MIKRYLGLSENISHHDTKWDEQTIEIILAIEDGCANFSASVKFR